jgi:Coenzyme PQQ synthesis protein D (PqqD)
MSEVESRVETSTVLRVSENVLKRTAGNETVLLDLDSEEFFGLDGVGARAFELFEQPRRVDAVVDTLLDEYDVDRQTLTADVTDLVSALVSRKLLVVDA